MASTFRVLREQRAYTPARGILDAMTYYFEDPDGNFVQQSKPVSTPAYGNCIYRRRSLNWVMRSIANMPHLTSTAWDLRETLSGASVQAHSLDEAPSGIRF